MYVSRQAPYSSLLLRVKHANEHCMKKLCVKNKKGETEKMTSEQSPLVCPKSKRVV